MMNDGRGARRAARNDANRSPCGAAYGAVPAPAHSRAPGCRDRVRVRTPGPAGPSPGEFSAYRELYVGGVTNVGGGDNSFDEPLRARRSVDCRRSRILAFPSPAAIMIARSYSGFQSSLRQGARLARLCASG